MFRGFITFKCTKRKNLFKAPIASFMQLFFPFHKNVRNVEVYTDKTVRFDVVVVEKGV